jgi:hypothetical protein
MNAPLADDERIYLRVLVGSTVACSVLLVLAFVAYLAGWLDPVVPIARLPELWSLPADRYLAASGTPRGWGWLALADRGDMANLVPAASIASIALACVAAVAIHYSRKGERLLAVIAWLQVAVLLVAVSGFIAPR